MGLLRSIPVRLRLPATLVAVMIVGMSLSPPAQPGPISLSGWVQAGGRSLYVATNGSDSNPGSPSAPWRTVAKGLVSVRAGDTLWVRGGTYVERIINPALHPGTPTERVMVSAYAGERPVVKGLLWLKGVMYWTFRGINVTWDPDRNQRDEHMVKMTNGVGWKYVESEIWGAHSYADLLIASSVAGQPAEWLVARNCIHDNYGALDHVNGDQLIYVNTHDSPGGQINRNLLFNAPNGEGVKLGSSNPSEPGPNGVVVQYNTIYHTNQSILVAWSAKNNRLVRNLMVRVNLELGPVYGNVRGYQLTGLNNVVHDNAGYEAHSLILNDRGYPGVVNGGGNVFPQGPQFDRIGCGGFHPADPTAQRYGRYAPWHP